MTKSHITLLICAFFSIIHLELILRLSTLRFLVALQGFSEQIFPV